MENECLCENCDMWTEFGEENCVDLGDGTKKDYHWFCDSCVNECTKEELKEGIGC